MPASTLERGSSFILGLPLRAPVPPCQRRFGVHAALRRCDCVCAGSSGDIVHEPEAGNDGGGDRSSDRAAPGGPATAGNGRSLLLVVEQGWVRQTLLVFFIFFFFFFLMGDRSLLGGFVFVDCSLDSVGIGGASDFVSSLQFLCDVSSRVTGSSVRFDGSVITTESCKRVERCG